MTVHFIGAGPGASDLITVRGRNLVASCPLCVYAGSLVPPEIVALAPEGALCVDSASLTLDEIIRIFKDGHERGEDAARLHSGDPSLYGAMGEQLRRLKELNIPTTITPGVPAVAAAAAALKIPLTAPGSSQSVILTRSGGRASPMPKEEELKILAAGTATIAVHLGASRLSSLCRTLASVRGVGCPAALVWRASQPEQKILRGTLKTLPSLARAARITRSALLLAGEVLAMRESRNSALYDPAHRHLMRPGAGVQTTPVRRQRRRRAAAAAASGGAASTPATPDGRRPPF